MILIKEVHLNLRKPLHKSPQHPLALIGMYPQLLNQILRMIPTHLPEPIQLGPNPIQLIIPIRILVLRQKLLLLLCQY
jgi:hypothetical protein